MGSNDGDRDAEFRDDLSNVYIVITYLIPTSQPSLQPSQSVLFHRYLDPYRCPPLNRCHGMSRFDIGKIVQDGKK